MTTVTVPDPPADLISPVARVKFSELAVQLAKKGELSAFTVDLLRTYSDAFSIRDRAITDLRNGAPLVIRGSNGNDFPNPLLKIVQNAESAMDRALRRLEFKPEDDAGNELEQWLRDNP